MSLGTRFNSIFKLASGILFGFTGQYWFAISQECMHLRSGYVTHTWERYFSQYYLHAWLNTMSSSQTHELIHNFFQRVVSNENDWVTGNCTKPLPFREISMLTIRGKTVDFFDIVTTVVVWGRCSATETIPVYERGCPSSTAFTQIQGYTQLYEMKIDSQM